VDAVKCECDNLRARVAELERLVLSLSEKLATVAEHLGRIAERKELRSHA
jgi:hypothetical protein